MKAYKHWILLCLAGLLMTGTVAMGQDYGNRLGTQRGGKVSFEPAGPGAMFSALDYYVYDPLVVWSNRKAGPLDIDFTDGRNDQFISHKRVTAMFNRHLDVSSPKVQTGWNVTKIAISQIAVKARRAGVEFSVLLIPSRSRVVFPYLTGKNYDVPDIVRQFVSAEAALEQKVATFLKTIEVPTRSAYDAMVSAMNTKRNVYPYRDDVHPLGPGHRVLALTAFNGFYSTK